MEERSHGDAFPEDDPALAREFLLQRYKESIEYYWRASRRNKNGYKITRYLTVLLGSLVTLISSLSAADFIKSSPTLTLSFSIVTPLFAATLAIVGGFSQAFQCGPTWREMVLIAQELTRECDRITDPLYSKNRSMRNTSLIRPTLRLETALVHNQ